MKRLYILVLLSVIATALHAQSFKKADAGNMGSNKFQVVYLYQANGMADSKDLNFTAPEVEGAKRLSVTTPVACGNMTSTSVMIVNGRKSEQSQSNAFKFTCTYKANNEGNVKVGAAKLVAEGHTYTAPAFTFKVEDVKQMSQSSLGANGPVTYNNPFSQSVDHKIKPDELMVRINMSKTHVYEQEAVVCSIKLYTLFPIDQGSRCTQEPSFDGFLIEDITDNSDVAVENYNGRNYYTLELRRFILYPQQAGTLTIKSGEYDINAVQRDTYIAGNHAFAAPHTTQIHITSNKASVTISPLPSPAPQGFNGAVGRYTITTSIEPTTLRTNASATMKAVVNGNGNIKYLKAPEFKLPDSFDTYEPQTETNVNSNGHDMEGEVTFSYPFTPTTIGDYTLPPLEFVYFDLDSAKYVTIKAPQQKLHVEKGNDAAVNKTESDKPADILPIIDDTSLEREHSFCVSKLPYWLWFIIPALLLVVAAIAWRRRLKQLADVKLMRTKRASKIAQKRLKQAKKYLNNNDKNAFYAEVLTASWGYLSDKLHIPVADLNKDNIDNELEQYGVDNDTRESMLDLLNKCEFAQYAPELSSDNLNDVYAQAATIIDKIESVKPNKKQQ